MRYQIVYGKSLPVATWTDTEDKARKLAADLRRVGYSVTVWEHTAAGSRKTDI